MSGWLGAGLLSFGFTVGWVAGVSLHGGISQALLTAVFGFVGGSVMTYAGFQVRAAKQSAETSVDKRQVGVGMIAFSSGVILGTLFGMWFRLSDPMDWVKSTSTGATPITKMDPSSAGKLGLHSGALDACLEIKRRLRPGGPAYADLEGALKDMRAFLDRYACE
jgi:hypothetical protein